jgi:hypothetical protein
MVRVLVTVEPRMYREAIALAVQRNRPEAEVMLVPEEIMDGQVADFAPHVLVGTDSDRAVPEGLLTNYLKTLVVGYHLRYSRKEEVPICPKIRPHRSRLPLYGEYPMSCGSSSNRSSKSTIRQSAPVVRA